MTTPICELCEAPVMDMARVCARCTGQFCSDLRAIPELESELEITLTRQTRSGSGGGRSANQPVSFHPAASRAYSRLRATLVSWARLIHEERGTELPADTLPSIALWLGEHVEWIRHHEAGAEAVSEIGMVVRDVRRVIDRPADREYCGLCDLCGSPLYARRKAKVVECRSKACAENGTWYDVAARRAWLLTEAESTLAPVRKVAELARALGVQVGDSTVYEWASKGRIVPHGKDARGRPTYRLGDVVALAKAARRRTGGKKAG